MAVENGVTRKSVREILSFIPESEDEQDETLPTKKTGNRNNGAKIEYNNEIKIKRRNQIRLFIESQIPLEKRASMKVLCLP